MAMGVGQGGVEQGVGQRDKVGMGKGVAIARLVWQGGVGQGGVWQGRCGKVGVGEGGVRQGGCVPMWGG